MKFYAKKFSDILQESFYKHGRRKELMIYLQY